MKHFIFLLVFLAMSVVSCNINSEKTTTITKRIQYDVIIKSPDPDLDWWVQNIEGMNRETFIHDILEAAGNGKIKVFDAFLLSPISTEQVRNIGARDEAVRLQRPIPPTNITTPSFVESLIFTISHEYDLWKNGRSEKAAFK